MDDPFELPPDVLGRIPLFAELQKVLSWRGGPVNWDLARQVAVSVVAARFSSDSVTPADEDELGQDVRLAELWLNEVAGLAEPSHMVSATALTPVGWAEHASRWMTEVVDPVAAKVTQSMGEQAGAALNTEEGMVGQAFAQLGPLFGGIQAGSVIGALATELAASYELGFPPAEDEPIAVVVPTVDRVAAEYQLDVRSARLWTALRATAHRAVFDNAWVRAHFFSLYLDYVASLQIDISDTMQRLQTLNLDDPTALQEALGGEGLFTPTLPQEAQRAADRVGALLAVVDAHALAAAEQAADRLGASPVIREAFARRAAGAAGGSLLARFVGLDPAARRTQARRFVRVVLDAAGWTLLNRVWTEPDAFPSQPELEDPEEWVRRLS